MLIKYSYYNITLAAHPAGHLSAIDQQKMEKEKEREGKKERKRRNGPQPHPYPYFTSQICDIKHPLDDISQRIKTQKSKNLKI